MSDCLCLRNVFKSYHAGVRGCSATVVVLRDVDLTVAPGEIVAISAAPAAGKTTLLMIGGGLMRPDRGVVSWFGTQSGWDGAPRPDGVAYAGEQSFPYGFLSAREALEYAAIVRDLPLRDSAHRVGCALERTRLAAVADRRVDALSASDLARLSVASAVLSEPRLLLVDDVASGCDATTAEELVRLLQAIAADGAGVVVAGRMVPWLTALPTHRRVPTRFLSLISGRLHGGDAPAGAPVRRPSTSIHARVAELSPDASAPQIGGR